MDAETPAVLTQEEISANQVAVKISRKSFDIYYITARNNALNEFERLADFIRRNQGKIITQDVFGACNLHENGMRSLHEAFGGIDWPITWIEGQNRNGYNSCGTQLYAISGTEVQPISVDGRVVGGIYEDEDAIYCLLGGIIPSDVSKPRRDQAAESFEKLESVLQSVGMNYGNVVRTWFYLDDILSWYDEFNQIRTEFFNKKKVFDGIVPASTGIGVGNPDGTAVVVDAIAIKPKADRVRIQALPSPLQCPALDYGSSFSRAIEVALPDIRRIFVSGTASIEPGGKTVYIGDIERQVALTMEVVQAILQSRGMDWADVNRAIAYFKRSKDIPVLDNYCKQRGLSVVPIAVSHADICRDDLLFEIEVDAAKPA